MLCTATPTGGVTSDSTIDGFAPHISTLPGLLHCLATHNTLVSPAMGATLHTRLDLSVFMTELLPVFGYPINPTL